MVKWARLLLAGLLALTLSPLLAVRGGSTDEWPAECAVEQLDLQTALICLPDDWNGMLVLYAHGYVPPQDPLVLPAAELNGYTLSEGQTLVEFLLEQDIAFATSSYSKNGYAVEQAEADLDALLVWFKEVVAPEQPSYVLIVGASEGGLIAVQQLERRPETYHGGLAMCGPVGGAGYQMRYLNDFRVVFDYFFPAAFDFGAADVSEDAYLAWDDDVEWIEQAILDDPAAARQLFNVTRAAQDPADWINSAMTTTVGVLYYSVWGAHDLIETAGGMPYDNTSPYRVYRGSDDDEVLNKQVERVESDPQAREYLRQFYQPSGDLQRPLVTLHTTRDPIVPFKHELVYGTQVLRARRSDYLTVLRIPRYGHCTFTSEEVLGAFALLVFQATGESIPGLQE